jgi:hypothetical protein
VAWQVEWLTPLKKMIMKILTHEHKLVNTCWCWHIYKEGGVWAVERGFDSSLPPAKLARRDSALFVEIK